MLIWRQHLHKNTILSNRKLLNYLGCKIRQVLKFRIEAIGVILDILDRVRFCRPPKSKECIWGTTSMNEFSAKLLINPIDSWAGIRNAKYSADL